MSHFVFPKWTNAIRGPLAISVLIGVLYVTMFVAYGFSPKTTDVGYAPEQPIPYSHELHVGQLGLDCRYCHNTVEDSAQASVPPTQTCINCHQSIFPASENLVALRDSFASGRAVKWVRVHDLPDYAYFNHSAHVRRGVSCVSCHGRVDKMPVVYQHEPLSMAWCLECHRNPDPHLRPADQVTNLAWAPSGEELIAEFPEFGKFLTAGHAGWKDESAEEVRRLFGSYLRKKNNINPSTDCSTCHR